MPNINWWATRMNHPYRVIITGLPLPNYGAVKKEIANFVERKLLDPAFHITTIISRGLTSTDKWAERYARENKIPCVAYSAKWDRKYDAEAMASLRDIEMAKIADALIAFYGPPGMDLSTVEAKRTNHIIELMIGQNKEVHIIPAGVLPPTADSGLADSPIPV
jgi:hypothetical protein